MFILYFLLLAYYTYRSNKDVTFVYFKEVEHYSCFPCV